MVDSRRCWQLLTCFLLTAVLVSTSSAQVEDQLSAYGEDNAEAYLKPLADAFGTDLNGGLFYSGHIPRNGRYFSFEIRTMAVLFSSDDRTFRATAETGFTPLPSADLEVSTIVGDGEAKIVLGEGGASFVFPGGFSLNSFALAVPQLRFGSYMGTEATIRYLAVDVGDAELGDVSLFGFGMRHSISQYLGPDFPVDLAGGFFWQQLKVGESQAGDDLMSTGAVSIGIQASRRYGQGVAVIEPYAGLSMDRYSMKVSNESEAEGAGKLLDLDFGANTTARLTMGLALRLVFMSAHAEYCVSGQNSFSFGLAFGKL